MIIVRIMGGLGNQMYQYALYRKMKLFFENVKIDILHYSDEIQIHKIRPFELSVFSNVKFDVATRQEVYSLIGRRGDTLSDKIADRLLPRKTYVYTDREDGIADETIYSMRQVYLSGYWQNYEYFRDIIGQLENDFLFPESKKDENQNLKEFISRHNCVSVHIRRGDFVDADRLYGGICTETYYHRAIAAMQNQVNQPYFLFFSDDQDWTRRKFADIENSIFPEANKNDEQYYDMYLMSICNHNIIANSSFSWWGAMLNQHENKIVYAPDELIYGIKITGQQKVSGWHYLNSLGEE